MYRTGVLVAAIAIFTAVGLGSSEIAWSQVEIPPEWIGTWRMQAVGTECGSGEVLDEGVWIIPIWAVAPGEECDGFADSSRLDVTCVRTVEQSTGCFVTETRTYDIEKTDRGFLGDLELQSFHTPECEEEDHCWHFSLSNLLVPTERPSWGALKSRYDH